MDKFLVHETVYIVVCSWDEVERHLRPFLGLLPYYHSRCHIVSIDWVWESMRANKRLDMSRFRLNLEDPEGGGDDDSEEWLLVGHGD